MDKEQYINNLKSTNLRPNKLRIKESEPQVLLEQDEIQGVHDKIIDFFMKNKKPADDEIHAFAEKEGINPHKFEGHIYMILGDILSGGRSSTFKGSFNPKELAMGIKIESEHIDMKNKKIAEKIAKDHLSEIPDYYSRLIKMEKDAGIKEKKNISELFIQQGEIEAMDDGPQKDITMLRLSMIAELDASNLYDRFAEITSNDNISKLMLSVSHEEKVHAGEFETLLEEYDQSYEKAEEEGEKEVEDMIEI